jgi:hypothetical protein
MSSDVLNDLEDPDPYCEGADFGDDPHDDDEHAANKYSGLGNKGKSNKDEMDAAKMGAKEAGWLDDSPNGIAEIDKDPVDPEVVNSGAEWKATVSDIRQQVLTERMRHIPANNSSNVKAASDPNENNVKVVDQTYLTKDFKAKSQAAQDIIDGIVQEFNLNIEQQRAFRIIANHAVAPQTEQLKMYLGGMGGTGKSQVFKALIHFFNERKESHRFIVLGPTGTSAALLGGSTYHSFLNVTMNKSKGHQATSIALVKGRLEGVEYIFLDEVSMVACHEMYKISSQLAKALSVFDLPFGGMNMIFAGDFAQLPPVGGSSLYSPAGTQIHDGLTVLCGCGPSLWVASTRPFYVTLYCIEWARYPSSSMGNVIFRKYMNFSIRKCSNDMIIVYS